MNRLPLPQGYGAIKPISNYCPWELDQKFRKVYRRIKKHTLIDVYRCYALGQMVMQTAALDGDILEVGVWRGGSGALLAHYADSRQERAAPTVWLADTFSGVPQAGENDPYYKGGEHSNTSIEIVETLMNTIGVENYTVVAGIFPKQNAHKITSSIFRLCHIDVDIYQSAQDALSWIWDRLVIGGVVVFDDYGFYGCEGVTTLVNEQKDKHDRIFMHNINGQGVLVKIC